LRSLPPFRLEDDDEFDISEDDEFTCGSSIEDEDEDEDEDAGVAFGDAGGGGERWSLVEMGSGGDA
jgi:hypothetical protein